MIKDMKSIPIVIVSLFMGLNCFPQIVLATSVSDCVFVRTMKVGVEGSDVLKLQQMLNNNVRTQVSLTGPGSLGNETTYFGKRTEYAVMKFQELYRQEILVPAGIQSATGFVGAMTLAKLRSLCVAPTTGAPAVILQNITPPPFVVPITTTTPPPSTTSSLDVQPESFNITDPVHTQVRVMSVEPRSVRPGERVIVVGTGYTKTGNIVMLGSQYRIDKVTAMTPAMAEFVVPVSTPAGVYQLSVSNTKGASDADTRLFVSDGTTLPPVVTSISPTSGTVNSQMTITGTGFTPSGNNVYLSTGVARNIASLDGKTLVFPLVVEGVSGEEVPSLRGDFSEDIHVFVENANGPSNAITVNLHL